MRAREFIIEDISPLANVTIYVDMDGVIVDLYNHIGKMLGVHFSTLSGDQWEDFYQKVDAYKLFKTAPMFDNAHTLLELVKNHPAKHGILSTPLIYNTEECIRAKREWLKMHAPDWSGDPIFTGTKEQYALTNGIPNILIDDSGSVIKKWQNAGGIGIRYSADADSMQPVIDELKNASQIISNQIKSSIDSDIKVPNPR